MRYAKAFENGTAGCRAIAIVSIAISLLVCGTSRSAQVYVTDSPGAAELVASAEDRLSKQEPAEAARLLQQLLDDERSRLLETAEDRYAEAHQVAAEMLLGDEQLLATYREMYGPTAARQLERAGADRGRLSRVRQRFPVTESALEAGLREAGLALASGQPAAAAVVLESLTEHPDIDDHRSRYQQLAGSTALLLDNQTGFQRYLQSLEQRGDEDAVAFLQQFEQSLKLPDIQQAFTPLARLPEAPLPDVLDDPLWQYTISGAERYLVEAYQVDEQRLGSYGEDGRLLNTMFAVADGVAYVNDGLNIVALDASSGMELWRRELTEVENAVQPFGGGNRYSSWLPSGMDINGITVGSDRVAAITGFSAMVTIYGASRRDGNSFLTVLDAETGDTQWRLGTDDVAGEFDEGFWYGQPIIEHNRVYATVRRRQRTQFQDAYVVCLDLHSGEPIWRRHIASTALTDRQSMPAMAHMTLHDGYIYIDSRLGTAARLAASDGSIAWLTRLPINEGDRAEVIQKPWHAPKPVLVEAGLIVVDDWEQALHVIDVRTGEHKQTIDAREWSRPLYLAKVGSDVLTIGESVERRDGETLERLWQYSVRGDHRGRAAVAENRLFLPAGDAVQVIDLETGERETGLDVGLPASLVALNGQVLAAGREKFSSYSSWELASRQMQQRIDDSPGDPRPLMAMAWLAFNTGRHDALLDTLDDAIGVAHDQPARRSSENSLFDQVMAMTRDGEIEPDLHRALFERVAALAETVEQEVIYRLALGEFHEGREQYADAMEQYQALLAEAGYRDQLYRHEDGARQAGLEAQRRMEALIEEHGRELYQPYEAFAARRLEQLAEQGDPDPLVDLAEAYPMAEVTPETLRLAARRAADHENLRRALSLLRQAAQLTDDDQQIAKIYGLQAELFEEAGQPHRARRVLRTLTATHPQIDPIRDGEAIAVERWMDRLAEQPQSRGVARLNLPLSGEAQSVPGRIITPSAQDPHATPSEHWLFRNGHEIELRSGEDFRVLWTHPLEREDTELLSMDRHRLWFWVPSARALRVLSAADGSVVWEDDEIRNKLQAIEMRQLEAPVGQQQRRVGPNVVINDNVRIRANVPHQTYTAVSETATAAADGNGRVLVFDSEDGRVIWQQATRVQTTTHLAIDGQYLMLAGSDADDVPLVCVYDVANGELLHTLASPGREVIRWMDITEDGLLVYLSSSQVEAFDLSRGQSRWICRPGEDMVGDGGAWLGLDRLVVRTRNGDMVWVDLSDGQVAGKLPLRGQLQGQVRARSDADAWFITSANAIIATDKDGNRLWRDAIEDAVRHLDHVLTDQHVVALGALIEGRVGGGAHGRQLYFLDRTSGVLTHEQEVEAPENLIRINATTGRVLLTGPRATSILHGSP